ncbi:MAG TPA: rhodanese-related sulfurtransferase [Bacteroidia bacterium]|nr:rhodanese-related sulfurtransferase [Bacteroidia bacterium]
MNLHNKIGKEELRKRLMNEPFKRFTLSFYRYVKIDNLEIFRNNLFLDFDSLNIFGRIYLAHEGINAQVSVPEHHWKKFEAIIHDNLKLRGVPFKIAVEDDGKSFYKLIVRLKNKIVADGLSDDAFDVTNVGKHLSAQEFNAAIENPDTVVIDLRNHYESEVGKFENALCPDADTFRDALPKAVEMAKGKEDHKILLYCTGGIRCEKASAYFKHNGFIDVNQLYGGIISYAHEIKEKNLPSKFIGKNFVFDDRLGERITSEIISVCHQCGKLCDTHTNCANNECHLLFIQCDDCKEKMNGCCTPRCKDFISLPLEQQKILRKGKKKLGDTKNIYKSRLRPDLKLILAGEQKK